MEGHPGSSSFVPSLSGIELDDLLGELRDRAGAVRDAHERLSGLLGAVVAISSELDLAAVLQRIVTTACSLVGARYGALGVLAPEREHLSQFITHGLDDETRALIGDLPHGRGVLGLLINDPQPLRLHDISSHPKSVRVPGQPPADAHVPRGPAARARRGVRQPLPHREGGRRATSPPATRRSSSPWPPPPASPSRTPGSTSRAAPARRGCEQPPSARGP